MANPEHLAQFKTSSDRWNLWRRENPNIKPDLSDLDFRQIRTAHIHLVLGATQDHTFDDYDLRNADLSRSFVKAHALSRMHLSGANLSHCDLSGHDFSEIDLSNANLHRSNLSKAILNKTNLSNANLSDSDLRFAVLTNSNLSGADLSSSWVYGISAWDVNLVCTKQENLVITPDESATISVDNVKLAQFIYLLLNNQDIRDVIESVISKTVLILGRFSPERKPVLDSFRHELRKQGLAPIVFDFEKPDSRDLTETVLILAGMSKLIIADITDPESVPHELALITQQLPSVIIQPIIEEYQKPYSLFHDLTRRGTILPVMEYSPNLVLDERQSRGLITTILDRIRNPAHW